MDRRPSLTEAQPTGHAHHSQPGTSTTPPTKQTPTPTSDGDNQNNNLTAMLSSALTRMDAVLQMNTLLFVNQMRIDAEIQKINTAKRKIADNTRARIHNALVPEGDRWFEVTSNLQDGPPPYPVKSEYHLLSMSEGQLRALFTYYYGADVEMDHLTYRAYIRDAIGCRPHRCNSRIHQSPPRSVSGSSTASRSPRVDWETTFSPIIAGANLWKTPNSNPVPPGMLDTLGLGLGLSSTGSDSASKLNELMSQTLASAGIHVQIPTLPVQNTGNTTGYNPSGHRTPSATSAEDSSFSEHPHTPEVEMGDEEVQDSFDSAEISFQSMESEEPLSPSPAPRSPSPQKQRTPTRDEASPFVVPASPGTSGTMVEVSPPPQRRITSSRIVSNAVRVVSGASSIASSHTELARRISNPESTARPTPITKERPQSIALDELDSLLSTEMEWGNISLEEPDPELKVQPTARPLPKPQPQPTTPAQRTSALAPDPPTPAPHMPTPSEPARSNGPFGAVSMVGLATRLPGTSLLSSNAPRPASSMSQPSFGARPRMTVSERLAASFAASRAAKAAAAANGSPPLPSGLPMSSNKPSFSSGLPKPSGLPPSSGLPFPPAQTSMPPPRKVPVPAVTSNPAQEPSPKAQPVTTESVALPPATSSPTAPPTAEDTSMETQVSVSLSASTASSSSASTTNLTARSVSSSSQQSMGSTSTASETVLAPVRPQSTGDSSSFLHMSTSTTGSLGIDDSLEEQAHISPGLLRHAQLSPVPTSEPQLSPQLTSLSQPSPQPQLSPQPTSMPQLSPQPSGQPPLTPPGANKPLPQTPAPRLGTPDLSAGMTDWEALLADTSTPPKLSTSASSNSPFSLRPNTSRGSPLAPRSQSSNARPLPQTPSTKPKTPTKLAHSMSAVPSSMSTRPEAQALAQSQTHLNRPLPSTPAPLSPSKTLGTSPLNANAPRTPSKAQSLPPTKYTPGSTGAKLTQGGTSPARFTPTHSPAQRYTPTHSPYTNSPSRRFTPTRYTPSESPAPPPTYFAPALTSSPNKSKRGASEPPPGATKPQFKRRNEYSTILEFWKQNGAAE